MKLDQLNKPFSIIDLPYPELKEWYNNAYTNVTEIVERSLLCEQWYFTVYLTWVNFSVRFILPTIILIVCNVTIIVEVSVWNF